MRQAEKECPTVFPGVGLKLPWLFDDPRGAAAPEEERLEKFREVRDQIETRILRWLEHPEEEIQKLKEEQERERQERLMAARREAGNRNAFATSEPSLVGVTSSSGVLESEINRLGKFGVIFQGSRGRVP